MSVFSKLSKEEKNLVFSGSEFPAHHMPSGTWDQGADYMCFFRGSNGVDYKFVKGAGKNTARAIACQQHSND